MLTSGLMFTRLQPSTMALPRCKALSRLGAREYGPNIRGTGPREGAREGVLEYGSTGVYVRECGSTEMCTGVWEYSSTQVLEYSYGSLERVRKYESTGVREYGNKYRINILVG